MKMMQWMGSLLLWLRVDCCRCSFWIFFFFVALYRWALGPAPQCFSRLYSESFKAVNLYRKCFLSTFTHARTHLLFAASQYIHSGVLFMAVFGVIYVTDVGFWRPWRNGRINWPPLPKSTWCLSEACLLLSQSRKSRKCWERKLYLAALLWLALAEKWNPDPLCSLRARTSFPVLQHPGLGNTVH